MSYSTMRHDDIFDHKAFSDPIHIIGGGGVGSEVIRSLAKLGCGKTNELHVWDGDSVAPHNLANQVYCLKDVGRKKTAALGIHARAWSDIELVEHSHFVKDKISLSGVVFLCVDTMEDRWRIWENCIKNNPGVPLFLETRMDASFVTIHVVEPSNPEHIFQWERFWYPDDATTNQAGCGGHIAVGPTANVTANIAIWQFIRYAAMMQGYEDRLDNQISMKMRPLTLNAYQW